MPQRGAAGKLVRLGEHLTGFRSNEGYKSAWLGYKVSNNIRGFKTKFCRSYLFITPVTKPHDLRSISNTHPCSSLQLLGDV